MMEENWKEVVGYEGLYEVSDLGRIKSLDRVVSYIRNGKERKYLRKGKILRPYDIKRYKMVDLCDKAVSVHSTVISSFVGLVVGLDIDHINNKRDDNRLTNLQQITRRENCTKDAINKTGFTGVQKVPSGKFQACIKIKGKSTYLGLFLTPEEASEAYQSKLKELNHANTK
jgi:hypothetical protein